jgi:glycosyltransferase involved in cell wall biosynthesis
MSSDAQPAKAPAPPLRVLFIAALPIEGPSSRFRIYQYLPYLERHGITAVVRPLLTKEAASVVYGKGRFAAKCAVTAIGALRRAGDVARSLRFDVAYVLREAFPFGPPVFERALRVAARRLIFDFDDAIWQPSIIYPNALDRFRDWNKPAKLIRAADHVVVGSNYLAEYALRYAREHDRVSVLPTVVDASAYIPAAPSHRDHVTIGWIGTPRNTGYLQWLLPALREGHRRDRRIRFVFVGAEPFACGDLPVRFKTWQLADEIPDIQSFDVGIMPLPDDEHTRGKCGFKLIQYMSCGIPVVCSPIGANCDIVEAGRSGCFAGTHQEWADALTALAADPSRRLELGRNGRRRVVESFSTDVVAPRLLHLLRRAATASTEHAPASP